MDAESAQSVQLKLSPYHSPQMAPRASQFLGETVAVLFSHDVREIMTHHGIVRARDTGGNGSPLLLIHSLLVDPDLYATLTPLLIQRGFRCIIPELPLGSHSVPLKSGADLTPPGLARLLVDVLDALHLETVDIVGVDTGGALAQLLMASHRERVGRVVLTGCDAYDCFPPRSFRPIIKLMQLPGVLTILSQALRVPMIRALSTPRMLTHKGTSDDVLVRWTAPLRQAAIRRDLRKVLSGMSPEYTLEAARLNRDFPRPVLVAWGDDARLFPRRLADQLLADLPHAGGVTLPDCAALAPLDQPQVLAEHIERHLRAVPQ